MHAKKLSTALLTGLLTMALNVGFATVLVAASAQDASAATKKQSSKSKKHRAGKTKFDNGSGESTVERNSRLARECKGRANSGMCSGFGQGS